MSNVARLTDICSGHDGYPPRTNTSASSDVFVNGLGAHRVGDAWGTHKKKYSHDSVLSTGSATVFVNGLAFGRVGDLVACGSSIATGSDNVFAGG